MAKNKRDVTNGQEQVYFDESEKKGSGLRGRMGSLVDSGSTDEEPGENKLHCTYKKLIVSLPKPPRDHR